MGRIYQGNKHGADGDSSGDGNKNDQTHKIWPIECENLSPHTQNRVKAAHADICFKYTHINPYMYTNM